MIVNPGGNVHIKENPENIKKKNDYSNNKTIR